jgi:hypothetical protein
MRKLRIKGWCHGQPELITHLPVSVNCGPEPLLSNEKTFARTYVQIPWIPRNGIKESAAEQSVLLFVGLRWKAVVSYVRLVLADLQWDAGWGTFQTRRRNDCLPIRNRGNILRRLHTRTC